MSVDVHPSPAPWKAATGAQVRAELEELLERDLLGPRDGPTEELPPGISPAESYLLGRLEPRRPDDNVMESPPASGVATAAPDIETSADVLENAGLGFDHDGTAESPAAAPVRGRSMAQSAVGLAVSVPLAVRALVVEASWGRY